MAEKKLSLAEQLKIEQAKNIKECAAKVEVVLKEHNCYLGFKMTFDDKGKFYPEIMVKSN